MRNISFSATTEQVRNRQKHVTRRIIRPNKKSIWQNLKPDEHLMGIEKGQGLKKGDKVVRIGEIVVLEVTTEPLADIIRNPRRNYSIGPRFDTFSKVCQYRSRTHGITDGIYGCKDPIDPQRFCCGPIACDGISETAMEGFPYMPPVEFVKMFMKINKCEMETPVVRILFDYADWRDQKPLDPEVMEQIQRSKTAQSRPFEDVAEELGI